jgi:hypothetical protein
MPTNSGPKLPDGVTRKVGPAPVWVWLIVAVVGYYVYKNHVPAAAAAASPNVQASGTTQGDAGLGNASGGLTADLIAALAGNFGVHDAYNTNSWSTVDSHDITTTTTGPTYGTGPTYPSPGYTPPSPGGSPYPGGGTTGGGGGYYDPTTGTNTAPSPVPIDRIIPVSTLTPPSFMPSAPRYGGVATG